MSEQNPIRVMLVDDHAVVRGGLKFFLLGFDDMELVGEAEGGEEALCLCAEVQPDVIMMDMKMPGMDGVAATQAIRKRYPQIQVVALTSFQEEDLVQNALQAGAISYLLKMLRLMNWPGLSEPLMPADPPWLQKRPRH